MMWLSKKSLHEYGARLRIACSLSCALLLVAATFTACDPSEGGATTAAPVGAEEEVVKRFLPDAGQVEGWTPEGLPGRFRGESLYEHINGGADIYLEYGFVTLLTWQYQKGDKEVLLELYCMDDPAAAFGIYSYNRHPTLSSVDVGSGGTIHANGLYFWQDRYYVNVRQVGTATILSDEFLALAKAVEANIGTRAEEPAIVNLLPDENMIPQTTVFARGKLGINNQVYVAEEDLFGLEKGEAAAIARYRIGQPEFSVIIAEYASEAACERAFVRLRKHFLGGESTRETEFVAKAMPAKYHGVRRIGKRLIVVANTYDQENALAMLHRISEWVESRN